MELRVNKKHIQWLGWGAIIFLFIFDRIIKFLLINGHVTFFYTINERGALSLPFSNTVVITVTLGVLMILFYSLYIFFKHKDYVNALLFTALSAGASSNLIDRFIYGGVVDYLKLSTHVPIFNVSDVLIALSIISLLFLRSKKP